MEQSVEVSCAAVSAAAISEETERERKRGGKGNSCKLALCDHIVMQSCKSCAPLLF